MTPHPESIEAANKILKPAGYFRIGTYCGQHAYMVRRETRAGGWRPIDRAFIRTNDPVYLARDCAQAYLEHSARSDRDYRMVLESIESVPIVDCLGSDWLVDICKNPDMRPGGPA